MKLAAAVRLLRERWAGVTRRFDALSLRERALVVVGTALTLLVLWDQVAMRPLYARARNAAMQLAAAAPQETSSDLDQLLLLAAQLEAQLAQKQQRLEQRAASLVDPERMNSLLTDVIGSSRDLRLLKFANLPVEELHAPVAADGTVADTDGNSSTPADRVPAVAYVHGIDITVAGDYAAVSSYIRTLETQKWRFLWRRLELDASKYPEVSAHIEVATLGLERQWLSI